MQSIWRILKSYVWWTHARGSVHYDVMVTLILLFIFLTPRWLFKDKPVDRMPHQTEVVVSQDGANGFVYRVDAAVVQSKDEAVLRENLLRVIEPIAGEVDILSFEPERDAKGRVISYRVRVRR